MGHLAAARSASLCITLFGTVTNTAIAIQVLSAWQNLKWGEVESEWAGDSWPQVIDGVKVMWALLSLYFASAAAVSAIGLVGIIRNKISLVKFYRDYSIVDFSFCALATLGATYASFMSSARAGICEEFSHHPELMRDLFEVGLNPENCEHWLVRAMIALIGAMFILLVIRLHFLLAVSNFYSQLSRQYSRCSSSSCCSSSSHLPTHSHNSSSSAPRRILLAPITASVENDVEMVYAPVPRSSLPRDVQTTAKEVWVSLTPSSTAPEHRHRHHRRRSRDSGRIALPIRSDEGLLPLYSDGENVKV